MDREARTATHAWLVIAILAVVFAAVRLIGVGLYPAAHPDEGFWASGARNFVLFGEPILDGRLHPFLTPATFVLLSGWFELFSPDLVSARQFSATMGMLTCLLMFGLSRRSFSGMHWLLPLLFGLSGLSVLPSRVVLLEAHQTFWLVLATWLWFSSSRASSLAAGAAFGVALLVKANSVYLLPAFALIVLLKKRPSYAGTGTRQRAGAFILGATLTAGSGYLSAYMAFPEGFISAFRFELDHFVDSRVWVSAGRFGLNPDEILQAVKALVRVEPVMSILALVGIGSLIARRRTATEVDLFFGSWLVFGAAFIFAQIYVPSRYLATLAPPIAYLSTRWLQDSLSGDGESTHFFRRRVILILVVLGVGGPTLGRVAYGIHNAPNSAYWHFVEIIRTQVPAEAKVLGAPFIGLSLPNGSYDFYRLIYPYGAETTPTPTATVMRRYGISFVIVDSEWKVYQNTDMESYVQQKCRRKAGVEGFELLEAIDDR